MTPRYNDVIRCRRNPIKSYLAIAIAINGAWKWNDTKLMELKHAFKLTISHAHGCVLPFEHLYARYQSKYLPGFTIRLKFQLIMTITYMRFNT